MVETKSFALNLSTYTKIYRGEQSKSFKKNVLVFLLMLLFVAGMSIYEYIKIETLEVFYSWLPFVIIYSIINILMYWLFPIYLYKIKDNKFSFSSRKYIFRENEVEVETENGLFSKIPYGVFVKKNIGKDYFSLWESALTAHMIPFSAFASGSDVEFVKKTLGENCV